MHEWNFDTGNVMDLLKEVGSTKDGAEFNFDISSMNWDDYIKSYMFGIRKYVLKDNLDSMENAKKTVKK